MSNLSFSEEEKKKISSIKSDKEDNITVSDAIQKEDLNNKKQNRELRKEYANRTFTFLIIWSVTLGLILLLNGIHISSLDKYVTYKLSENTINILLGTSFLQVTGIFLFVMKYLFK